MSRTAKSDADVRERANILLVDDRPDKHVVYRSILEELGQNLVSARSGEEALREVLKSEFAVILLDVNMPGMDGLETAAMIRGRKRSAHVPIIFITADYGDELRMARGIRSGQSTSWSRRSFPRSCAPRSRSSSTCTCSRSSPSSRRARAGQLAAERTARAAAERANEASAFLARASAALAGSLNLGATTRELARLVVPFLADVGVLTIAANEDFEAKGEVVWAGDGVGDLPDIEAFAGSDCRWWREAIERVSASGRREIWNLPDRSDAGEDVARSAAGSSLEIPDNAKLGSLAILPMIARGAPSAFCRLASAVPPNLRHAPPVDRRRSCGPGRHRDGQRASLQGNARPGSAQERVPRDAVARAAQSARADHQCRAHARHRAMRRRSSGRATCSTGR
jgi:CheY-like chemotaxis protein